MILPESRNLEWIEKASADNHASNPLLVEKVIRAFSLLEALARSGCPFILVESREAKTMQLRQKGLLRQR